MTYATFEEHSAPHGIFARIWAWLGRVGQAAFVARGMEARMEQVQRLQAKSDAELAEMGLNRDDIAYHVFRDIMYS